MPSYYFGLIAKDEDTSKEDTSIQDLCNTLSDVLYCSECRGKGTIFRYGQPDAECQCRQRARQLLDEFEGGR